MLSCGGGALECLERSAGTCCVWAAAGGQRCQARLCVADAAGFETGERQIPGNVGGERFRGKPVGSVERLYRGFVLPEKKAADAQIKEDPDGSGIFCGGLSEK